MVAPAAMVTGFATVNCCQGVSVPSFNSNMAHSVVAAALCADVKHRVGHVGRCDVNLWLPVCATLLTTNWPPAAVPWSPTIPASGTRHC